MPQNDYQKGLEKAIAIVEEWLVSVQGEPTKAEILQAVLADLHFAAENE